MVILLFFIIGKIYNSNINYYLIEFIIYIAYSKIPEFKNIINKIPNVPCSIFKLSRKLKDIHDEEDFICPFNKLSKRRSASHYKKNKITNYGFIIDKYKLELKNEKTIYQ